MEVVKRDVLAEMERASGKHWSEFTPAENAVAIVANYAEGRRVTEAFKSLGDTNCDMSWAEFKTLLTGNGFEIFVTDSFTSPPHCDNRQEEIIVAFDTSRCLLLVATSYGLSGDKPHINSGTIYAEVSLPVDKSWGEAVKPLGSYSGGIITERGVAPVRMEVYYDIREGLIQRLRAIEDGGITFCQSWTIGERPRHLWLCDYGQTHKSQQELLNWRDRMDFHDRCTQDRIDRLPEQVRRRIGR